MREPAFLFALKSYQPIADVLKMADLFECTICKTPFVAEDKGLISRRNGCCADCTKAEFLKSIGLPPDFLNGFPAP